MSVAVIINPISGRARRNGPVAGREQMARAMLRDRGLTGDVVITRARGHGREMAEAFVARGVDRLIAWGGDGTVNEIAGPLIGSATTLGIVPSGSGDGFARSLGLPLTPRAALARALDAPPRPIDVGRLGGRHFLNIGGIGFDAAIARAFDARRRRGAMGYVTGGLTAVWSYRCRSYELEIDGERLTGPRFLVTFANGRQYGNGIVIAPDAGLTDGWLNAVVVADGSPLRQLWRARRLAIRRLRPAAGVLRRRVTQGRVSGESMQCHVDGEPFDASGEVSVSIAPGALRVAAQLSR